MIKRKIGRNAPAGRQGFTSFTLLRHKPLQFATAGEEDSVDGGVALHSLAPGANQFPTGFMNYRMTVKGVVGTVVAGNPERDALQIAFM